MVRKGSHYLKRKFSDIRNKILESLIKYSKSTHEVATDINCDYKTAKKHLLYLESVGKVKNARFNIRLLNDKTIDKDLWMKT